MNIQQQKELVRKSVNELKDIEQSYSHNYAIIHDKKLEEKIDESISAGGVYGFETAVTKGALLSNEHIKLAQNLDPNHLHGSDLQKHGCAAEHQEVHDRNVAKIRNGQSPDAKVSENGIDTKVDIVDGNTEYQLKFCKTSNATYREFLNGNYDDVRKIVPKDQYEDIVRLAKNDADKYARLAKECKENGDIEGYKKNTELSKKAENISKTTEPASTTYDQSQNLIAGRYKQALLSTAKDCHMAGLESAAMGAAIGAVTSGVSNIISVVKDEKSVGEAVADTITCTAKTTVKSYFIGCGGALLKTGLTTAANSVVNETAKGMLTTLSSGSVPTMIVVGTVEFTKSIIKFSKGEITAGELGIELGEKTVGLTTSTILGGIATTVGGPVAGIIVSMVSYAVSTALYNGIVETIRLAARAEEIARLTKLYEEAYKNLQQTRREIDDFLTKQSELRKYVVSTSFKNLEMNVYQNDFASFNQNIDRLFQLYSSGIKFRDFKEFDSAMRNHQTIYI